ncbi:MAG: S-methyl-5-thioribose-1-phosphate isomerase [Bacteriovoracaceae bacterium]
MSTYSPIIWKENKLFLLDQRLLPHEENFVEVNSLSACATAITDMVVRGAPCIGFSAIYGMALWVQSQNDFTVDSIDSASDQLIAARPTAVNLAFEVNRCRKILKDLVTSGATKKELFSAMVKFGDEQILESEKKNTSMGQFALNDLKERVKKDKWNLMTHCNTGFLACGSLGTALGVISLAHREGRVEHIYADETRPYLQGSRLTAFELSKENIPYSIVVEGAASYLMANGKIDAIFVGADRIAKNGDTANKVGTSTLSIVAKHYGVPFYVVAPISSFDLNTANGNDIEIEMRPKEEITQIKGVQIAPLDAQVVNPSFDVTDHKFITGIVCEKGFIDPSIPGEVERVVNL